MPKDNAGMSDDIGSLWITRKPGESLWIGDDIEVVYQGCKPGSNIARIQILAPKNVVVLRDELIAHGDFNDTN